MPSSRCAVTSCSNYYKRNSDVSFHILPVDINRKRQWEAALGYQLSPYERVCSAHFRASDYYCPERSERTRKRLKGDAVPSVCLFRTLDKELPSSVGDGTLLETTDDDVWVDDVVANFVISSSLSNCADSSKLGFPSSSADGSVVELDDVARCLAVGDSFSGSAHTSELAESCGDHIYAVQNALSESSAQYTSRGTQANRLLQVDRRSIAVQTDSSIEQRKCCKCACHGSKAEPLPPDFAPLIASTPAHKRYKQLDVSTSSASFCESAAEDREDTSFRPSPDNSMQEDTTELPHAERKFIVFESALLKLFERCAECSQRCKITTYVQGTLLKITAECGDHYKVWYSQPLVNGMAAGNILLCAAIMFGGASPTKVLRLLASVNISVPSKTCCMVYQKGCLVPAIKKAWKAEQADLFVTLKGQELRLLGDGRCDSPGHSAKYLTYNFVDAETSKVVHSIQVQVGESPDVKSSSQMEKAGFVKGLDDLRRADLKIAAITTDRHPSIRKHLRDHEPEVEHELDSWHVAKGLQKKLDAASKRKECSSLRGWIRNICNHLYFCVALSEGDVTMRLSIWKSLTRHIINVHDGHEGPFHRCLHDELPPHEWLDPGTPAYQKLVSIVLNPRLLKDIEQLSTASQTSCLESFHSLINQFAPKSTAYTPSVMRARTQLAILHHNENVVRDQATDASGNPQFHRKLPKSCKGREVLCPVKTKATHEYVQKLLVASMEECALHSYCFMKLRKVSPQPAPMSAAYPRLHIDVLKAKRMLRFKK